MYYFYFYNSSERTNMSTKAPNIIDMVTDCANDTSHNPYSHFAKIILKDYRGELPGLVTTLYDLLASGRVNGNLVTRSTFIQVGELLESGIAVIEESSYRLAKVISLLNEDEVSLSRSVDGKPGVKFWSGFTVQLSTSFYRAFDIAKRNAIKRKVSNPTQVAGSPTPPPIPVAEEFVSYSEAVKWHFVEAAKEYVAYWNKWVDALDADKIVYLTSLINMFHFERIYMQTDKTFGGAKVSRLKYAACVLGMSDELYNCLGVDSNRYLSEMLDINLDHEKRTVMHVPSAEQKAETAKTEFVEELINGCTQANFQTPVNQLLFKLWSNPLMPLQQLLKFMEPICGLNATAIMLVKLIEADVVDLVKENGKTKKAKGKAKLISFLECVTSEILLDSSWPWNKNGLFLNHAYHFIVQQSVPPGYSDGRPAAPNPAGDDFVTINSRNILRQSAIDLYACLVLRKELELKEAAAGIPKLYSELGYDYSPTWDEVFGLIQKIEATGIISKDDMASAKRLLDAASKQT